jgi:dTDP-4-dehydrorhamnose reductase
MKKRLLVTGYGGFVAGSVAWQADESWEVHAISRSQPPQQRHGFQSHQFDLTDSAALRECCKTVVPDAVIHCAAIADIDYCMAHHDEAEKINTHVPRELAALCKEADAKLVHCSTDTVFDGEKGMYTESDTPAPVNFYGETKMRAEAHVQEALENSVIARLPLVMGVPVLGAGNSFLAKMMVALGAGKEMGFPENEMRTPADVITLGAALLELAGNNYHGIIHLSGSTRLNRYEMGLRLAEALGFPKALVLPTNSNAMKDRAPRPLDVSLDNEKAQRILDTPMRTLEEGLQLILDSKEKQNNE